ncbi:SIMPL domain-containing protein [Pontibaca sp. S1109L]|uniref:SIMPL domain-containing protein n=2 Tax=Pontibaca salina TaxID=2795731 RepID=A0A934HSR1_9RHOB|nr:SIMPL domain-containing protein [Pontibaca salina]MBI6629835.1 SIMPL domain-containing protein [Pontibaca salina]
MAVVMSGAAMADDMKRHISVTGEGQVEATPDMVTLSLGVTHEADEAADAMSQTSDAVAQILARLTGMGLEQRDVQTRSLTLNPVWSNQPETKPRRSEITGYVASNIVIVRVRNMDKLGGILDAVVADGANTFNGLSFGLQEPDALADKARKQAVADGRAKAELLAQAAGVKLGQVISITDQDRGQPMPRMMEMSAMRDSGVPVASGEVTIDASVSMIFAIGE